MPKRERVEFEVSLNPADESGPVRLCLWVRRFLGDEELTGRYEIFETLERLDAFIARTQGSEEELAALRAARDRFAASLGKTAE
jgi:hypothetical protein